MSTCRYHVAAPSVDEGVPNPTLRWLHATRQARLAELVRRHRPAHRTRALEIGPGSGAHLPLLASLFEEVVASDVSADRLHQAHLLTAVHENLSLEVDDISATRLAPHSFDLILGADVIGRHAEPAPALGQMARLLVPGGVLILAAPQRNSPLEWTRRFVGLPGVRRCVRPACQTNAMLISVGNPLTGTQLRTLLRTAGFTVCADDVSGFYLPLIAEFGGRAGLRGLQWLAHHCSASRLRGLLETQYCVVQPVPAGTRAVAAVSEPRTIVTLPS